MTNLKLIIIWLSMLIAWTCKAIAQDGRIIPLPKEHTIGNDGNFVISKNTEIVITNRSLKTLADLLSKELSDQIGLNLSVKSSEKRYGIFLTVDVQSPLLLANHKTYGISAKSDQIVDERYTISITKSGIYIVGATEEAVSRGCATLRQIVGIHKSKTVAVQVQTVRDAPLFAWRGLSLDISRSFIEVDEVKSVINMMALYKMNVLHMHLTDNQGWRIEIKKYPELATKGGFVENKGRKGGFYTQEQFKDLISYAAERQITVVPEIDLPGHCDALFKVYPSLINAAYLPFEFKFPGQAIVSLDPDDEEAMKMVENIFTEVIKLTPGKFIHIGSDETFGMQDDKFVRFVKRVRATVHKLGKSVIGWQEMARAEVGEGDVLQNWISISKKQLEEGKEKGSKNPALSLPENVRKMLGETYRKAPGDIPKAVEKNAKILLSPSAFAYLDCPYEEKSSDSSQKAQHDRLGLQAYARQSVRDMYDWDPAMFYPKLDWKENIAGVEAAIWGETIETFSDMQFLLLPRLTGIAEKGWTISEKGNWQNYRIRLAEHAPLWKHAGWNFFKSSLVNWKE